MNKIKLVLELVVIIVVVGVCASDDEGPKNIAEHEKFWLQPNFFESLSDYLTSSYEEKSPPLPTNDDAREVRNDEVRNDEVRNDEVEVITTTTTGSIDETENATETSMVAEESELIPNFAVLRPEAHNYVKPSNQYRSAPQQPALWSPYSYPKQNNAEGVAATTGTSVPQGANVYHIVPARNDFHKVLENYYLPKQNSQQSSSSQYHRQIVPAPQETSSPSPYTTPSPPSYTSVSSIKTMQDFLQLNPYHQLPNHNSLFVDPMADKKKRRNKNQESSTETTTHGHGQSFSYISRSPSVVVPTSTLRTHIPTARINSPSFITYSQKNHATMKLGYDDNDNYDYVSSPIPTTTMRILPIRPTIVNLPRQSQRPVPGPSTPSSILSPSRAPHHVPLYNYNKMLPSNSKVVGVQKSQEWQFPSGAKLQVLNSQRPPTHVSSSQMYHIQSPSLPRQTRPQLKTLPAALTMPAKYLKSNVLVAVPTTQPRAASSYSNSRTHFNEQTAQDSNTYPVVDVENNVGKKEEKSGPGIVEKLSDIIESGRRILYFPIGVMDMVDQAVTYAEQNPYVALAMGSVADSIFGSTATDNVKPKPVQPLPTANSVKTSSSLLLDNFAKAMAQY